MIDLHCHILPGIDDGAKDLEISLDMARASVANGVSTLACTPHILPGVYHNTGPQIRQAVDRLRLALAEADIPLHLVTGADVHIVPDLVGGIQSGHLLTLHDTRYVLLELPHHVAPPQIEYCFFNVAVAGYVPIFTHPERLSWIKDHYDTVKRLAAAGVWMQITAGALRGTFGPRAKYWGERMLGDGIVHLLASDSHNVKHRPPDLAEGWEAASRIVGAEEAGHLVVTRPYGILNNTEPDKLPLPPLIPFKSVEPNEQSERSSASGRRHASAMGEKDRSRGGALSLVGRLRNVFGRSGR